MSLARWLGVLGCLCLLAIPAQADPTVQDFSNPGVKGTPYTEYGTGVSGFVNVGGPPGGPNATYYRLCSSGVGGTNWMIAFDQTDTNDITGVQLDFDYSLGGTVGAGSYADGLGVALIPVSVYGNTGNGPGITAEGSSAKDGSIAIGLDTFDNGFGDDKGFDLNNNSLGVIYVSPTQVSIYSVDLGQFGYQTHQDTQSAAFDHMSVSINIDPNGAGATVNVTITSNQTGNKGDQGSRGGPGTSLAAGTSFTPIKNLVIPGVMPYQMRLAFGARTGGATDNEDITNVNCVFTP